MIRYTLLTAASLLALSSCQTANAPASAPPASAALSPAPAPAGTYRLDPTHASLVFTVSHLGFSNYTAQFRTFDATLVIDPANPEAARLTATIDPKSLQVPAPPEGFLAELIGADWLNTAAFPAILFSSERIEQTGQTTADVTGTLNLLGTEGPVTMNVKFNGGYPGFAPYDPAARIGFSASGTFRRSDFGLSYGLPPEGSSMGVGDEVTFRIETEFTGPPLAAAAAVR
jgi:polyisoprenoid-binding protein YceI